MGRRPRATVAGDADRHAPDRAAKRDTGRRPRATVAGDADRHAADLAAKLGAALRDSRTRSKLSQAETAARAGIAQATWSKLERTRDAAFTLATWNRAAFAVGTTLNANLPQASAADEPRDAIHLKAQELVLKSSKPGRLARPPRGALRHRSPDVAIRGRLSRAPAAAGRGRRDRAHRGHRLVRRCRRADAQLAAAARRRGALRNRQDLRRQQQTPAESLWLLGRTSDAPKSAARRRPREPLCESLPRLGPRMARGARKRERVNAGQGCDAVDLSQWRPAISCSIANLGASPGPTT